MDNNDDWLYDSIKNYTTLNMYDLPMNPQHLLQIDNERLVLAGKDLITDKTELLNVRMPKKLFLPTSEKDRNKNNDFEIESGKFIGLRPVLSMKALKSEKIVAHIGGESGLTIFNIDNLRKEKVLGPKCVSNFDTNISKNEILLVAKSYFLNFDMESKSVSEYRDLPAIFMKSYDVDCCYFGDNVFAFIEQTRGSIFTYDRRIDREIIIENEQNCNSFVFGADFSKNRIISLNENGDVSVYDDRYSGSVIRKKLNFADKSNNLKVCLNNERFSVAGFDNSVYVFTITGSEIKQEFKHFGHNTENLSTITDHIWFPDISDKFLVSCADNGTLNCWEFVSQLN